MREQQFLIPNLILQLGMHDISGPYWLLVSVDVGYLIMHAHFSYFYIGTVLHNLFDSKTPTPQFSTIFEGPMTCPVHDLVNKDFFLNSFTHNFYSINILELA